MADTEKTEGAAEGEVLEASDFESLLKQEFKPKSDDAQEAIQTAVGTLAEFALRETTVISEDVIETINAMVAEIDQKLTDQINLILHNDDFQKLEGAWRGLHHLVNNAETGVHQKIKVFNIGKDELRKTLKRYKGVAWDQSPFFKKIYEEEYGQFGGSPFGCLVGDYHFDHSPMDVELLGEISRTAAASFAPFIAGLSPTTLNMDSFQELANPRDLKKIFEGPEYAAWNSMRDSMDSMYVGLAMPRFLARQPYGEKTDPVDAFDFEEDTEGADSSNYCWANSCYAMATNIAQAFSEYGWCTQIRGIESGGLVTDLPTHTFPTDDGGVDMKCPTEIAISDRREKELADCGFMPLIHKKNSDMAAFIGAQSLHAPREFDNPDATASENLSSRLPYQFAVCRFAHYLKQIVRDKIGGFKERSDMEVYLNNWIGKYVENNPAVATDADKARKPLAGASVEVQEVEGNPGYYTSQFKLRPHYQLEGLDVELSLTSKLAD